MEESEVKSSGSILGLGVGDDSDPHLTAWRPPTPPPTTSTSDTENQKSTKKKDAKWKKQIWNSLSFATSSRESANHSSDIESQSADWNADEFSIAPSNASDSDILRARSMSGDLDDLLLQDESQKGKKISSGKRILLQEEMKKKEKKLRWLSRSRNRTDEHDSNDNDQGPNSNESSYQMMRSFHGPQQMRDKRISSPQALKDPSTPSEEEKMRDQCSFFYMGLDDMERKRQRSKSRRGHNNSRLVSQDSSVQVDASHEYFSHPSRIDSFVAQHNLLNLSSPNGRDQGVDDPEDSFLDDDDDPFLHLFGTPGKGRKRSQHDAQKPLSGISQSSLSFWDGGRVQIRLPNDNVRLMMDPYLEAGILSVETGSNHRSSSRSKKKKRKSESGKKSSLMADETSDEEQTRTHTKLNHPSRKASPIEEESKLLTDHELNYVLTVDENVYKRVIKEIADSRSLLYGCCHDNVSHVNICVAIGILTVVFGLLFVATIIWPLD